MLPAALLICAVLAGCGKGAGNADAFETEPAGTLSSYEAAPRYEGKELPLPLSAAAAGFLINEFGKSFEDADALIPCFTVIDLEDEGDGDAAVWGDFWCFAYRLEDGGLVCSGAADAPGCMHFKRNGNGTYRFTSMETADAGDRGEESMRELFGDRYGAFTAIRADQAGLEALRAQMASDYAKAFGLPASSCGDYGWTPEPLPAPSPDDQNLFVEYLREKEPPAPETAPETVPAEPEPPAPVTYTVKRGDTLGSIAKRFSVSVSELGGRNRDTILEYAHRNGVRSGDLDTCLNYIYPGEVLEIP